VAVCADKSVIRAAPTTKLELTAAGVRKDEERFFQQELARDNRHGSSSALHSVPAPSAAPAPVGSWAFDHHQQAAQIRAAVASGTQAQKAAAQLHLSLLARQAEVGPVEMLSGKAGEAATLQHLAYVNSAMQAETAAYRQSLHGGVMSLAQQQQMVQKQMRTQGGYGGVQMQPAAPPTQAPSPVKATSSALAEAEHLGDVRVVQQAVMVHEGVKAVKLNTAGSWKMDHGSTMRAATQQGAVSPPAPAQQLAANIPHNFGGAIAIKVLDRSGSWVEDHSGQSKLELSAAKVGGVERTTVPSAVERAAALLHSAEQAAEARSQQLAHGAVQLSQGALEGTWARDHGALDGRKPVQTQAQKTLAESFSHDAEARAVEAGFAAHGDDTGRLALAKKPAPSPGSWALDH